MNPLWLLVGLSNVTISVACIASCVPLVLHKIKMNKVYGIRIRKAFSSPDNWEKINEYGGRALIYWTSPLLPISVGMFVVAFLIPRTEPSDVGWVIASALLPVVMVMGATIQILMWSKKLPE